MTDVGPHVQTRSAHEQALAETFVTLADTLVDDYDVADLLDRLVTACVDLLGATAAGLLLDDQRGNLAVVASSSQETRMLELFALQTNEGPCLDCVRTGTAITSADLAREADRWPLFVPEALGVGFRSVIAVPLRLRKQTIGGLSLFSSGVDPARVVDQQIAQALADVATIGIIHQRSLHRSTVLSEQLQQALHSRVAIEQAKGVLSERNHVETGAAFDAMRHYARNNNLKLTDVAIAVVQGTLDSALLFR